MRSWRGAVVAWDLASPAIGRTGATAVDTSGVRDLFVSVVSSGTWLLACAGSHVSGAGTTRGISVRMPPAVVFGARGFHRDNCGGVYYIC